MASRDYEVTNGEDIDVSIKRDYEEYKRRVDGSRPKKLNGDVNMDIIAQIVSNKLRNQTGKSSSSGKKKKDKIEYYKLIMQSISVLLVVLLLFSAFQQNKKDKEREAANQQRHLDMMERALKEKDIKPEDAFKFEDAKNYQSVRYYGKEKDLKNTVAHVNKIKDIVVKKDAKGLKHLSTPQKNFLLAGPPGTGKTLFVKKMAGKLNLKLKKLEILTKIPKDTWRRLSDRKKVELINKMPSRVRVIFLTPSFINDKYIGESEKRVKELFRLASLKTEYLVTLIFFDEMDAFFAKRDSTGNETHVKAQTELLANIGGVLDDLERPVFIFGATNRVKMLDDAFYRRFNNKIVFNPPEYNEIKQMVENATLEWEHKTKEDIDYICREMERKKYVQNIIMELISDVYMRANEKTNKFKALIEAIRRYKPTNDTNNDMTTTLKDYSTEDEDSLDL